MSHTENFLRQIHGMVNDMLDPESECYIDFPIEMMRSLTHWSEVVEHHLATLQPYCLCGATLPYDHNLGCPHAVRPTPEVLGCATCATEPRTPAQVAKFQAMMTKIAERTIDNLLRGVEP